MHARTHVLVDTSYLAYRAFHSLPALSYDGVETAVMYGVFKSLKQCLELMEPGCVVSWAFDVGRPKRLDVLPEYKMHRKTDVSEDKLAAMSSVNQQITRMRESMLKAAGYQNVFWADGYEADDIIASLVNYVTDNQDDVVIMSADHDLYQLLRPGVYMWKFKTRTLYGNSDFIDEFGVLPEQYAKVKAMAGCVSDNIPGIKGVGEKTACKYLLRDMKKGSKAYKAIRANKELRERNLALTELPYEGTPMFVPSDHLVPYRRTREVLATYGIRSLDF